MNSIPQRLLGERTACLWTPVRRPIVHLVLLVFKKSATRNTEPLQVQCAVTQLSTPHPAQKLAEHRSGISQGRKYMFSKLSTEKG